MLPKHLALPHFCSGAQDSFTTGKLRHSSHPLRLQTGVQLSILLILICFQAVCGSQARQKRAGVQQDDLLTELQEQHRPWVTPAPGTLRDRDSWHVDPRTSLQGMHGPSRQPGQLGGHTAGSRAREQGHVNCPASSLLQWSCPVRSAPRGSNLPPSISVLFTGVLSSVQRSWQHQNVESPYAQE